MNRLAVLEGLLFVVGDDGLTLKQICDIMELSLEEGKDLILELKKTYEDENRGIKINILGDRFKLSTKKEHREYYQKLVESPENNNLSQAALETLAIVAYNEPLTRMEIDEIRGVNSREMLRKLVAKGLVKEEGRSDLPGRPILYATTNEFLDYFGLSSKDDLPKFEKVAFEEKDDTDLYHSKYTEEEKNTE
ncbi:MAG: SMC-Scp complex subunit ScpB [Bacilli bacterium]|nr:SMC-Scp complex subunit ScpB [Bacilli bacterium]